MTWWVRPLVRLVAALMLPLVVPLVITLLIWSLPGDPAEIICPPGICTGTEALAERWHLDEGPWGFFSTWLGSAISGDLGNSWRLQQGGSVAQLMWTSLPNTVSLVLMSLVPIVIGSAAAASGLMPRRLDPLWQVIGLAPVVILALFCAAYVQITYGFDSYSGFPGMLRLILGALVLGLADGALAAAVVGTRSVFEAENKQRYVGIAVLRGETPLSNTLPNVTPALMGQLRSRVLQILSGAVIVEVVLEIEGLGDLLWRGTLLQDFGVVLAAAWAFSLISAGLLLAQALVEVFTAVHIRYSPAVPA